jgi:release factor glutamine methyltransferase
MGADLATLVGIRPTVREAIERAAIALRIAGIEDGRVDAEWLLAETLGLARGRLHLQARQALGADDVARYVSVLRRRLAREPLQHIMGREAFRGLTVRVTGDALVPRPETELLAGWALELMPPTPCPCVIDVGTGSGCIACALAAERPQARVLAVDVSSTAAALARDNVEALGLEARVSVHVGDLFAALPPDVRADVVVSNPPYLPSALIPTLAAEVSRHDPRLALDGGDDGLAIIRRLVADAPAHLAPGGWLVLETAGGEQVATVETLMRHAGFVSIRTRPDLAGITRFVAGGRPPCQPV